jgi:hyperosmotically inducible protein
MTRLLAALFTLTLLASVCLAADKPTAKPVDDNLISDQVRIKLSGDALVGKISVTVDCVQGVVTLSGVVESSKQKDRAASLTKKVKGVKQVVNNLVVKK